MKTVNKIVAFVMLALWLPVTQHCDLDAAGFEIFPNGGGSATMGQEACPTSICQLVEDASARQTGTDVRVIPPSEASVFCLLVLVAAPVKVELKPVCLASDPPEIEALHRTWHFARRTALPTRAPSRLG